MQLDGGERAVEARGRAGRGVEVDAARGEGVLQAGALAVEEIADVVGIERAGGGRGAEEAAAEARALLVGPVDEADLDRRRRVRGGQRAHDAERGEEAERAVEPAAGRDRVDVRSDDDEALRRAVARQRGPDVPGRVVLHIRSPPARSSSFASSQSRAACQSGVHARRRAPSGPPKRSWSSRRSARTPSTSIASVMRAPPGRDTERAT